jgi:serine/threonine protein phosphatase 1
MDAPLLTFAIGDVHGELAKLEALHAAILERIAAERVRARIIHLGDYVDRGPDSRGVIERLMALQDEYPEGGTIEVHALMGNHEALMVQAWLENRQEVCESWFMNGGLQTLDSYAGHLVEHADGWRDLVPKAHIQWLRNLPTVLHDVDQRLVFVHAGIDPARFPECNEMVHLWTRSRRFFSDTDWPDRPQLAGLTVVHGHTPTEGFLPEATGRRINVDTGAVFGGVLTAAVLKAGEDPSFICAP